MSKTSKAILGIAGALAAGVVIGMLVAPEKGSETRKKWKDTSDKWMQSLSDTLSHLFAKADDIAANDGNVGNERRSSSPSPTME